MGTNITSVTALNALQDARNLATQVRSQGLGVVADAVLNLQNQMDQATGFLLSQIKVSVSATRPVPSPGSNPIAPYTDLPTGFAISNLRYSTNAQGQQTLKMDAVWTPPADAKYGGSYIIMKKPSDITATTRMELNAGKSATLVFSDFPTATENWQFWLVSQNTTGQLNTSLTSPITGTPTVTVSVTPPPLGSGGTEYTSNVAVGIVAVNATSTAEGTVQQYISAGFTPPNDASWGGVELRIYFGGNLLAKNKSAISPITVNINNPSGNVTYTWKLVSYDVNGHSNTETGCPTGTLAVGSVSGSFTTGVINGAIANIININASNITTGSLTAVTVKVTNAGGSGVVTDITQGFDASAGINSGIVIKTNGTNSRIVVGPLGFYIFNSSNVNQAQLVSNLFQVFDGAGGGVSLSGAATQFFASRTGDGAGAATLGAVAGSPFGKGRMQLYSAAFTPVVRIETGTDGSDNGYYAMFWGGTARYAPGVIANGKRLVWGSTGNFNGLTPAQATVNTGLTAVEGFFPTVVAPTGFPEYAFIVSAAGGSITFESSNGGSTRGFNWWAVGT